MNCKVHATVSDRTVLDTTTYHSGGNNAHAANIVSGIFLATGQDAAQAGTSAMTMVITERVGEGDLYMSATMPCLEVCHALFIVWTMCSFRFLRDTKLYE